MLRIIVFSVVLFHFSFLFLFAQTKTVLKIETADNVTRISNGEVAVSWDSERRIISVDQNGLYAQISLPNGKTAVAAEHPVTGRDGQPIAGASLVIKKDGNENIIESIYTLTEHNPFVQISTCFTKESYENGLIKTWSFPKIELFLPEPADKLKSFGTAGLRSVDGHKGSYSFLAVTNPENRNGVVTGWITHRKGSGIIFSNKNSEGRAVISPTIEYGKLLPPVDLNNPMENLSELFVLGRFDDCRRGLERYAWQIAGSHRIQMKEPPSGYCTWYADKFGGACNETEIVRLTQTAAEKLAPYGFNFVQIDSGWQTGISKNGHKKNFTQHNSTYQNGMKKTAQMIRSHKMLAGIWFMPFAGSREDSYWNKNWFVKSGVTDILDEQGKSKRHYNQTVNKLGEPYESFWGGTSLDLTHPDVQKYLHDEVKRIAGEWEFNYFKLDGLWTGMATEQLYVNNEYRPDDLGEPVFHNPNLTPIAAYRKGFEIIRQAAGNDVFILGCNVSQNMRTLGASFGCVDAMRIGPDNGVKWNSHQDGSLKVGPWHGSNRYFLNGRVWWNDPDPVYVRNSMPLAHARLIASWVAVSGQLFAFSDWLPNLSEERIDILRRTIRHHGLLSARPVDLFSEDFPKIWHLTTRSNRNISVQQPSNVPAREIVAFYNWDDKNPSKIETTPAWIGLPDAKEYVAFDFWDKKFFGTFTDKITVELPPGSCLVLAVRPVAEHPILLSTPQHITQGMVDVIEEHWNPETKTLSGVSRVIGGEPYELRIYDPLKKELRREILTPAETSNRFSWNVTF